MPLDVSTSKGLLQRMPIAQETSGEMGFYDVKKLQYSK